MNILKKLLNWYFSKESLPYWCLLLVDTAIVIVSALFTYWVFEKTLNMFEHRFDVLYTACFYGLLSWVGARLFATYSSVVRYSSFVDLLRVAYANGLSMVLALLCSFGFERIGVSSLCGLSQTETAITFFIATLVMWLVRIMVKALYDVTTTNDRAMRVLIYGALTGGVGLAKSITTQKPVRFRLCGFISHSKQSKHYQLMGRKVYSVDDDIERIIESERIQAILVSPYRVTDFRKNQEIQDTLIKCGVKIFMAQQAKEAVIRDGELTDDDFMNMQMKEVSVEDLLPRSEIKVDMDSVGAMLTGKKVMITGSAGSIGSEMVRQIAVYKPALMVLIDQAETPQHDVLLMTNQYPDIKAEVIVTSICHEHRMERIFKEYRPDYVFHAAAYKHVPMMENNPSEAVLMKIFKFVEPDHVS